VIPQLYTNPELEQITTLILLGHNILKASGLFVGKHEVVYSIFSYYNVRRECERAVTDSLFNST